MELRELYGERRTHFKRYTNMIRERLIEILRKCGLYDVDVYVKDKRGRLFVEKKTYNDDYEVNFYHYTKKGVLSKNSTYTGCYVWLDDTDEQIKEKLLSFYSVKGE